MRKIYFFSMILIFASQISAGPSAQDLLSQSQIRFDHGEYSKALELLKNLDIRHDFDSSEDMITAFKIRAISYTETKDLERAKETIRELLFIDPDYKFDLFDTPKSVVVLAEAEAKEIFEKNKLLQQVKTQEISKNLDLSYKPKVSFFTTLLPLGLNHYYLGNSLKGTVYLSIQTASLAANIGAFWWKQSYLTAYGIPRLKSYEDRFKFNAAQITQYVALSTLIAALGVSIIDAMISYQEGKL